MSDEHALRTCSCDECYFERRTWEDTLTQDERVDLLVKLGIAADWYEMARSPSAFMFRALSNMFDDIFVPHK